MKLNINYFKKNWDTLITLIFLLIVYFIFFFTKNGIFVFVAVVLTFISLVILYRKQQKYALVLISLTIIALTGIFAVTITQPDLINTSLLGVGITAVLVVITAWYASITEKNVKISERSSQGKYIAEIARSIFSPMIKDLELARNELDSGSFLLGITDTTTTLDRIHPPNFYLKEKILIRSNNTSISQQGIDFGVVRSAPILLKQQDEILKKYYSTIEFQSQQYSETYKKLINSISQISTNAPLIWNDFKKYCDSLDSTDLKNIFNEKSVENPHESNYCMIFRNIITNKSHFRDTNQNETYLIQEYKEEQPRNETGQYTSEKRIMLRKLANFIFKNKENLNQWLNNSKISGNIVDFHNSKNEFIKSIDTLTNSVENLLLAWKLEYYLTEDEMHLKEEYWDSVRAI